MELDNKDLFIQYLKNRGVPETGKDYFQLYYFTVKVQRRNKDFRTLDNPYPKKDWNIKVFRLYSIEEFEHYWEEIKTLCKAFKARAYFSINFKDKRVIILKTIQRMVISLEHADYGKPWTIYESEESQNSIAPKLLVVDIDNTGPCSELVDTIKDIINNKCRPLEKCQKVIATIPTVSGLHLITLAFAKEDFIKECILYKIPLPGIQQNGLSLLYYNDGK